MKIKYCIGIPMSENICTNGCHMLMVKFDSLQISYPRKLFHLLFFFCYNYNEITFLRITVSQTLFQWLNVDFSQRLKIKSYSYHLILNQKLERHSCIKIFLKRLTILYAAADTSYLSYKFYNLFLLYVFLIYHQIVFFVLFGLIAYGISGDVDTDQKGLICFIKFFQIQNPRDLW